MATDRAFSKTTLLYVTSLTIALSFVKMGLQSGPHVDNMLREKDLERVRSANFACWLVFGKTYGQEMDAILSRDRQTGAAVDRIICGASSCC